MRRELREIIGYTFAVIALVLVMTHRTGFASFVRALSGGYRDVVGAFITPTKA